MDENYSTNTLRNKISAFGDALDKSKKYWIIYLVLIVLISLINLTAQNYSDPQVEFGSILIISILGVFCISYFYQHNNEKELYKTAFIIILVFGIIFSFVTPMMSAPDEVEHFVRTDITSRGIIFPEFTAEPFNYSGVNEPGSYLTIQSTLDLIEDSKKTASNGFDSVDLHNATIFGTDSDTKPINHTLVKYHSAFAQNPFFGYIAPAIGMALAKLLDLNAVWLLWLGRIFNVLLYASLIALAIRKTPILKLPLLIISCIPLFIYHAGVITIDSMINGLSILAISYFFYMYKSPKESIEFKDLLKFSAIILLVGLCKITCFSLILLLFCVPKDNFKKRIYLNYRIILTIIILAILLLWSKYIVTPGLYESCRYVRGFNSTAQIHYMISHSGDTLLSIFAIPNYLEHDLGFTYYLNPVFLMFLGAVCFMYPHPKFNVKTRISLSAIFIIFYIGTYISFMLSWMPVGKIYPIDGVWSRYFFPVTGLLPFILGINNFEGDKTEMDSYLIMLTVTFIAFMLIHFIASIY